MQRLLWALLMLTLYPVQGWADIATTTNAWLELTNTKLSSVCPTFASRPDLYGARAATNCHTITAQWAGGTWDGRNHRMLIIGGGHGTYHGNEPYSVNLAPTTPTLTQADTPFSTGHDANTNCTGILNNGEPGGRHTYSNLAYLNHRDILLMMGGSPSCDSGGVLGDLWAWNSVTSTWSRKISSLNASLGFCPQCGGTSAGLVYDVKRQKTWFHDCWMLVDYVYETNTATKHDMQGGCEGQDDTGTKTWVLDHTRDYYIGIGGGTVVYTPVGGAAGTYNWTFPTTSGSSVCSSSTAPGLAYDPVQDRIICVPSEVGSTGTVYILNHTGGTWTWTTQALSGTPPEPAQDTDTSTHGTFGRLAYSWKDNAFVFYGKYDQNAFAFRLTSSTAQGSDFVKRCTAPGVTLCQDFDDATDLTDTSGTPSISGTARARTNANCLTNNTIVRDTTTKNSGAASLKLTSAATTCTNHAGFFWQEIGRQFTAHQTLYLQYALRLSPEMRSNWAAWTGNGSASGAFKTSILHRYGSSCGEIEATIQTRPFSGSTNNQFPYAYSGCGAIPAETNSWASGSPPTYATGTPALIEQGSNSTTGHNCAYPITGNPNCFQWPTDTWMTLYCEFRLGSLDGTADSELYCYESQSGAAYSQFVNVADWPLLNDGACGAVDCAAYTWLQLTIFHTDKQAAGVEAYAWYDDVIVSTQPIPVPLVTASATPPIQSTGGTTFLGNVRIQ